MNTLDQVFRREEQAGLRLAMKGRLVALAIIAGWIIVSRPFPRDLIMLIPVLAFALNSLIPLLLTRSQHARPWFKYLFASIDVLLIALTFFAADLSELAEGLPAIMVFRFDNFPYLFVLLTAWAFAYSPLLVLWTGLMSAAAWLAGFAWIVADMEDTLTWSDIPRNATAQQYLDVFLDPRFIGSGSRVQEAVILIIAASLLALAVHRARGVVRRQAEAEHQHEVVSQTFGRYVPPMVAEALINDRGMLEPVHRIASVLFVDIAGFTNIAESRHPTEVVDMLNAYFDTAAAAIAEHGGVITQFQGDAILATFNVPLEDPDHARNAVAAGLAILDAVAGRTFAGVSLQARVGLNTGELVAGSVGSSGRQNYTVHGDAVNLAARLEALNKEHGTHILVSEATVRAAGDGPAFREIAVVAVRGKSTSVRVYTVDGDLL